MAVVGENGHFKLWPLFIHFHYFGLLYPRLISMLTADRKTCKEGTGILYQRGC